MKASFPKNRKIFSVFWGLMICILVTGILSAYYTIRYPEKRLEYSDLLQLAELENYSIKENGLTSTTLDPIIVIPLSGKGSRVKAISTRIDEMSGTNSYWAQIFLYDDQEWVIREYWVYTGSTDYLLTGFTRIDGYKFLRLDLC